MSKETLISIEELSKFRGFRFSPTDEELISFYLAKKIPGSDNSVDLIPEVEICNYEPWDLPAKSTIPSENEWFFFSPRGRKYPKGSQSKRGTESGYWKATGKERQIKSGSNLIGTKRTLVFHKGRAPKGERTEWIMHEYCMAGESQDSMVVCRLRKNTEFQSNKNPRQSSLSPRNLSTDDSNADVRQSGLQEGSTSKVVEVEGSSKEHSSTHESHSIEQKKDAGSDTDQNPMNELSQLGSSSYQGLTSYIQGFEDDECFAEILKDDIIDLGELLPMAEPFLPPTVEPLPTEGENLEHGSSQHPIQSNPSDILPGEEGITRLSQQKAENYQAEPIKLETRNEERSLEEHTCPNSGKRLTYLLSLLLDQRADGCSMAAALFTVLALLVMLVFVLGPGPAKRFTFGPFF
ncbi:hypothetical protein NMG60_11015556 [Bertholletia excelsa]